MEEKELMHEPADVSAVKELADDEVRLSDGRVVKMRELTGADEAAVALMLGDKISLKGAGAQVLVQANTLKAIVSIDGQPLKKEDGTQNFLKTYNDFLASARMFKSKDLMRLMIKYTQMNVEADLNSPLA